MRFKQFLLERDVESFEKLIEHIKSDCQPYIQASRGKLLYRGVPGISIRGGGSETFDVDRGHHFPHPKDRKSKDSTPEFTFMFNACAKLAFDINNVRSKSVFATGSVEQAGQYGGPAIFYPAGKIKFLASSVIDDSYERFHKMYKYLLAGIGKEDKYVNIEQMMKKLGSLTNEYGSDVNKWLKAHIEEDVALKDRMREMFLDFYNDSTNLPSHIKEGHEILFYQTDGFYMIPGKMMIKHMNTIGRENAGVIDDERVAEYLDELLVSSSTMSEK